MKPQTLSYRLIFWLIIFGAALLVLMMAGLAVVYQVRDQQAQATMIAAPTMTAEFMEFHYQKGLGYANIQRWPEAQAEFELIFEIDPNYKDVQAQLNKIYTELAALNSTLTPIPPPLEKTETAPAAPQPEEVETLTPAAPQREETARVKSEPLITDGLMAYYPFDGNANDESGNSYDGRVYGAVLAQDRFGEFERAYSFSGRGDYILTNVDAGQFANDFTISAWVNFNNFNASYPTIFIAENYYIVLHGQGPVYGNTKDHIVFYQQTGLDHTRSLRNGSLTSASPLQTNRWYFVTIIKDGLNYSMSVDAVLHAERSAESAIPLTGVSLYIGANIPGGNASSGHLNGLVDDIRIYNRPLNEVEITLLYHEGGWPEAGQ